MENNQRSDYTADGFDLPVISASRDEIEITPEMIEAGIRAANLITYEFGSTREGKLVSRVYRAMRILE